MLQVFRVHCPYTEGLRSVCDGLDGWLNTQVELCHHVDAHAVAGDKGCFVSAADFQTQGIHVDVDDIMEHRQDDCAAVHDDFLAAKTSPHEGNLF